MNQWTTARNLCLVFTVACGGDGVTAPPDVLYGETTVVYLMNPVVNDANVAPVPAPGSARSGVAVQVTGGPSGTTGANGEVVLRPLSAGTNTVSFSSGGAGGQLGLDIAQGDLREVAVALDGTGANVMADVGYTFGGEVVELAPAMPLATVNAALARSNITVFLRAGTYQGDLAFSGSDVTLFGEGPQGGTVTIDGSVVVTGSRNRIRGARITGNLSTPGSQIGLSYTSVAGNLTVDGSNAVLLNNAFCGSVTVTGSGLLALGNAGLSPLPAPSSGC
ncbi:MAG: hypothetical protein ACREMX_18040 [Gemmatimonadales bacterium]